MKTPETKQILFTNDLRENSSSPHVPEQQLAQLPLLTEEERQLLLVEWNDTATNFASNVCVHQLVEAQVERTPDAVAVVFEKQYLTYRELNGRANQVAHYLRQLGVGPEVLVGVCMERSIEMLVALLGILKAGGAYVPLDPAYPMDRIAFMLTDAQVPVLITQQHLLEHLPAHEAQVICLDADVVLFRGQHDANLTPVATADNVAYVIYTSGSTGRPKGVQVLQRALVNFLLSMRQQPGLTAEDTLLAVTTLSFDIAALELFLPLIVGARLIVASGNVVRNGVALAELLDSMHVTVMQATPITWRILLAVGWQGNPGLKILCGGEALSLDLTHQLLPKVASLWNMYGPTETTIWSSVCKIEPTDEVISIGRPIANTSMYVLDSDLQLVPIGELGELYIGGDGLARGYLNRPELTSEQFILYPFRPDSNARLYKTGDLARYLPDGRLECLGRIDHQVKIRGFRIELGEIEAELMKHPSVQQAVVVAREDGSGDKRLVAYVVLDEKKTTIVADLQDRVQKALPEYMLPSAFVELEALPLTPNGKVDRLALPAPEAVRPSTGEPFVAPTSLVHHQLQQIWEELLDVRPIGIHDNFFDLGGHSLLAARLVDRVEQGCGKKITFATLFAGPTIEQLANALQTEEDGHPRAPIVAVQSSGTRRPFFYLHGSWNSNAFYCFHLARHLGPDQPFYALETYHFDDLEDVPTVEAIAAAHLESIRTIQPEGPYLLGGFCNGGLVAYEIARQLHAEGQRVDLLVLVDADYPRVLHSLVLGVISHVGKPMRFSKEKQLEYFLRLRHVYKYMLHKRRLEDLEGFRAIDPSIQTLVPTVEALRQDNNILLEWLAAGYNYDPYPGKIMLVWAREEPFRGVWRQKAAHEKNIEMRVIPGTHITCRTDHVQDLAEELRGCLDEAQGARTKE